jgi:hypothetical protein
MKKLIIAFALLFLTGAHAGPLSSDPGVRVAVTPMLGLVAGFPGVGIELGMGHGRLAWGLRYAEGTEFCMMCEGGSERERQIAFLAGGREELTYGSIAFRSGIVLLDRDVPDNSIESRYMDGVRAEKGFGIPFQLDLILGGRFIGLSLSATVIADDGGGSAGIMAGIPFGLLRR